MAKYIIKNYPIELINIIFNDVLYNEDNFYTDKELNFIENKELINKIIKYRKDPLNNKQLLVEVKPYLKFFTNIIEKTVSVLSLKNFSNDLPIPKTILYNKVDVNFIINILMYLDIDKLKKGLFNDEKLFAQFEKLWNQYKIGGWGNNFDNLLDNAYVDFNGEIVASFITYFGSLIKDSNLSLPDYFNKASTYCTESKKYSNLFESFVFKYIASNPGPNSSSMLKEKRIEESMDLLKFIRLKRKYVTIPPMDEDFKLSSGKIINIVVGNFSDPINLIYGELTGSCMRVGGAGESLFNYCLKDMNGFHIKFSNPSTGKFVSRVSGYRNGNTVFLNELRFSKDAAYDNNDIVEACQLLADKMIEMSKGSPLPIENVVISPNYAMEKVAKNYNLSNVEDSQISLGDFYTDVTSNSLILSTISKNDELFFFKPSRNNPKYNVQRGKIVKKFGGDLKNYLIHLMTLDQFLSGTQIENISIKTNKEYSYGFVGEDWCVMVDDNGNIHQYIMNNSLNKKQAYQEMQEALVYIKENANNDKDDYLSQMKLYF